MASQESRPLLADERQTGPEVHHEMITRSSKQTPLPEAQLGVLCFLRTLDPMNFTQIFPYINEFMTDLHVTSDLSQIGFYSGLVVGGEYLDSLLDSHSASRKVLLLLLNYSQFIHGFFSGTPLFFSFCWVRYSSLTIDCVGRRPVVLAGVAGLSVTSLLFGTSTSFKMAMIFRALGEYRLSI